MNKINCKKTMKQKIYYYSKYNNINKNNIVK